MQINTKNNNQNINFQAKFVKNTALTSIVEYAVEKGKFDKLNQARKNIDSADFRTLKDRVIVDYGVNDKGQSFVSFTRMVPKKHIIQPQVMGDYNFSKPIVYTSGKKINYLKYAYEMIVKMGNDAPKNRVFRNVFEGILK